jgi:hypothetical protein
VDPKGDQWGIRSSADGKTAGFPIVILGGEHGDAPLEPSAGEVVAKLVVHERVSVLIDLSFFRKHEVATFMAAFLENLYRLKAQEEYRTPMMLVIDDADAIATQKPQKGEERMLGAAEDIVRRGGQRGIGCALITQRSAVLNKNVLTQAQMLIVLRTIAPQDLAAMKAWIDVHGTIEEGKTLMDSLPSLPIGDAWFWSPGWPTAEGIFKRAHVFPIETFDSGATPKPGQKPVVPKNLADVDLDALKKQMAATIEKAKNDDPRLLRKRIAELEKAKAPVPAQVNIGKISQEQFDKEIVQACKVAIQKRDAEWKPKLDAANEEVRRLGRIVGKIADLIPGKGSIAVNVMTMKPPEKVSIVSPVLIKEPPLSLDGFRTANPAIERTEPAHNDGSITGPEQRILDAIAWANSIGIEHPENPIIAFLSGYTNPKSTGYTNPRGYLVGKGLIAYPSPGRVELTSEGSARANQPSTPASREELHRVILERLTGPQARILQVLLEHEGESVPNEELAQAAGYTNPKSTGYTNPRGNLRSYGLTDYPRPGFVRAKDILFI